MSSIPKPTILTLHSAVGKLTDPEDIVTYLIRHFVTNPGKNLTVLDNESLSMRELAYAYGNTPSQMAGASQEQIQSALVRYFPGQAISVEVYVSDPEQYLYTLTVEVSVVFQDGRVPVIQSGKIIVTKDNEFKINFNPS